MKIMAIDYGDVRTGIAVSDVTEMLVGTTDVICAYTPEKAAQEIAERVKRYGAEALVMGYPKNMDGSEGTRAEIYRAFAKRVEEATGLPVALWDERRTTVDAHRILSDNNIHGKKRKQTVDAVAASLILEGYLAFRKREKESQR